MDLLADGVPYPPFSKAGKQLGSNDERDLFPEALRRLEREPLRSLTDHVHPRKRKNTRRRGTGMPISQRKIQPSFPDLNDLVMCFFGVFIMGTLAPAMPRGDSSWSPLILTNDWEGTHFPWANDCKSHDPYRTFAFIPPEGDGRIFRRRGSRARISWPAGFPIRRSRKRESSLSPKG